MQGSICAEDGLVQAGQNGGKRAKRVTAAISLLRNAMAMPQWPNRGGGETHEPADSLSQAVEHIVKNATWDKVAALAQANMTIRDRRFSGNMLSCTQPISLDESVVVAPAHTSNSSAGKRCEVMGSVSLDLDTQTTPSLGTVTECPAMVQLNTIYHQLLERDSGDVQTAVRMVLQDAIAYVSPAALQGLARAVEVAIGVAATRTPRPPNGQCHRGHDDV
jgi:hypothetical protein